MSESVAVIGAGQTGLTLPIFDENSALIGFVKDDAEFVADLADHADRRGRVPTTASRKDLANA